MNRADGDGPRGDAGPPPYADLTPDRILDALASIGLLGDGRLLSLNSYENRVYQIHLDDAPDAVVDALHGPDRGAARDERPAPNLSVVVKFYRPGRWLDEQILEEHAFTTQLEAREIPVVPPLAIGDAGRTLHHFAGHRFAVFRRQGGRPPELDDPATRQWIGRFIGRIHAVGRARPFETRPALDVDSFGIEPRDWLLGHDAIPPDLLPAWRTAVDLALDGVREAFARCPVTPIRLHGDNHPGNVLWTDDGPHFVDFDDCRSGPAVQDLWMLLAGDRETMTMQLDDLLTGYRTFCEFDERELQWIEPLRTLRLIHYSAWLARRWHDPAFPAAFPWFGTSRYWQDRVLELREQIAAMQEPALVPTR
ncbi:MAG: serine/threonine protein kinase [Burkholderiaceae bacterium]